MLAAKLKAFLESRGVQYEIISHSTTYTAEKTAEDLHMRGEGLAKSVIVKMDNAFAMAVLPTSQHVDTSALQKAGAANTARSMHTPLCWRTGSGSHPAVSAEAIPFRADSLPGA